MSLRDRAHTLRKQFTATGYVTDDDESQLLMIFHRKLGVWIPPGGHVDPDEFPSDTALRETREETGLQAQHRPAPALELGLGGDRDFQLPTPLSVSAQLIPRTAKEEEHIHIDHMYHLVGDPSDPLRPATGEVDEAGWFSREKILDGLDTFDSVRAFARNVMHPSASG